MNLDFSTLYIIILLNSFSFAVVWAAVALAYRSMIAARYWLIALVMTCAGGPLLFVAGSNVPLQCAGLAMISGSFAMMWQGIRVYYGQSPLLVVVAVGMGATFIALLAFGPEQETINVIAAISQIVPVALAIGTLVGTGQRNIGVYVAVLAAGVMLLGQGAEAVTNALRITGGMSGESYYSVAGWFLICAIIGGSIWNLGFLLLTVDRLQSELKALATHDDLTSLLNRRGLREKLVFFEKSIRSKQSEAVLMMIDLDKFKAINDRFGHAAGDAVLVNIATIARRNLRDDDVLARVGGDEFCVLLPHTDLATASVIAGRLTEAIGTEPLLWKGQSIRLSASIGLTEWMPGSDFDLADSISLADSALLGTKRAGRNGHSVFNSDPSLDTTATLEPSRMTVG